MYAPLTLEQAEEMQVFGASIEYRVLSYIDDGWWKSTGSIRKEKYAYEGCEFRVEVE